MLKLIIPYLFFSILIYSQSIKNDVEKSIRNCFGQNVDIEVEKLALSSYGKSEIEREVGQKFFAEELFFYKINMEMKIIGYALLDNVYGKSLPITFLVMYDTDGNIRCSEIIKYREPYGGAIQNKDWNDQFKGKNIFSQFKVGSEIKNISGATISVNSVTKGVKKLTILINRIIKK